jgi:serine/threonine protein kinase
MEKRVLAQKKQLSSAYLERDFMIKNSNSKFLVHLHSTFQDKKYLYIVMDYIGGGDLLHLLIEKDIFSEEETKFYVAELVLALEEIH